MFWPLTLQPFQRCSDRSASSRLTAHPPPVVVGLRGCLSTVVLHKRIFPAYLMSPHLYPLTLTHPSVTENTTFLRWRYPPLEAISKIHTHLTSQRLAVTYGTVVVFIPWKTHSRSDSTDLAVRRAVFNKVLVTYWGYLRLSLRRPATSADGLSVAITPTVAQASCARLRPTKPPAMRGAVYKSLQEFQWNCVRWAAMMETDSSSVTATQYFFWKKRSLWHLNIVFTPYKCSISGSERR